MASIIATGFDDTLLTNLKTKLTSFEAREIALDPTVAFDIEIDAPDPWACETPIVNMFVSDDAPDSGSCAVGLARQGVLTVHVQCFAPKKSARLRYLKQQALAGLFRDDYMPFMGFESKEIDVRWPKWSRLEFEDSEMRLSVFAGEWTFEVKYAWEPESTDGTAIAAVTVDTSLWSGEYDFTT